MTLSGFDWFFVIGFLILSLAIGIYTSRKSGKNSTEFFLSGRNMPWWLLGISMVATTFSADTPNLVTNIVRQNGVSGNWVWWSFLLTGMLTVFVYAKLWRRSQVLTDLEFYELRYTGRAAAFLRGFRAVYLGLFFNVLILATVSLAAIKMGSILLGLSPIQTLLIASVITAFYSALGGLRGVILTDFFQFIIAMVGSIWAAIVIINLPEVGGLNNLLAHENLTGKLNFLPDFSDSSTLIPLFIIPIAVQWWSAWYPGAEPGGGGYIAQRMLAAKDEKHAVKATLFFNIAHYALRPWPWILIALASLVVFPTIDSIQQAFPQLPADKLGHDLGYPAMLTYLPNGLLGLVVASLIAAFMSTLSTQLNWGSSYLVHDFYRRFVKPTATEKDVVKAGRISTVVLMIFAAVFALLLSDALQGFQILLQIGAGTGLIYLLRWFWWRINAISEITAMFVSFTVAIFLEVIYPQLGLTPISAEIKLLIGVAFTTVCWILATFLTKPTDLDTLINFVEKINPHKFGWKPIVLKAQSRGLEFAPTDSTITSEIGSMFLGCVTVYTALFATGYFLYGNISPGLISSVISVAAAFLLALIWRRKRRQPTTIAGKD